MDTVISSPGGPRRVVVGVDGSPGGRLALAAALRAAVARDARLDVVTAVPAPVVWTRGAPVEVPDVDPIREDTRRRARDLVGEVRGELADVPGIDDVEVTVTVTDAPPVQSLRDAADGAELLVVGSRGRGGLRSALLGSVALHCTSHAPSPVLVVHPVPADVAVEPRVVVGVDGSPESQAALAVALDEASRSGARVDVVAAYNVADHWTDLSTVVVTPPDEGRHAVRRQTEALVEEALAARSGPAPSIRVQVVDGPPGYVLVRRARGAQLLVVGSRGHGALGGLLLGSVALHCAMHAPAPVLVVRPSRTTAVADAAREPALAQG